MSNFQTGRWKNLQTVANWSEKWPANFIRKWDIIMRICDCKLTKPLWTIPNTWRNFTWLKIIKRPFLLTCMRSRKIRVLNNWMFFYGLLAQRWYHGSHDLMVGLLALLVDYLCENQHQFSSWPCTFPCNVLKQNKWL